MFDKNSLTDIEFAAGTKGDIFEYIPIACHYSKETLLSKDSCLIQIVEITGFNHNSTDHIKGDLRKSIRDTIVANVEGYNYAIYFHTIRSRKNLAPQGQEPFGLAQEINDKWNKQNNWDKQLGNTLYLSIVRQSPEYSLNNGGINFGRLNKYFGKFFTKANDELSIITDKIIKDLSDFGARKLTMLKNSQGYISEQLMFYHQLTHLYQAKTPVPVDDLSKYLANFTLDFDFNEFTITSGKSKNYGTIYSLKEYIELPISMLDKILQLGSEFIITQIMYFVSKKEAHKAYADQYAFMKLTDDENLIKQMGFDNYYDKNSNDEKANRYCAQQAFITIYSDDAKFFKNKVHQTINAFRELGLPIIKEDFFLPKIFWSQLPGNFRFIEPRRIDYINARNIAGYSSIHYSMSGNYRGSQWGAPISLFRSIEGTPYYFNFHDSDGNGNTMVFGAEGAGKCTAARFILAQSCKLNPRLIYLDIKGSGEQFIQGIGGKYVKITKTESVIKINPFSELAELDVFQRIKDWLINTIYPKGRFINQYDDFFNAVAERIIEIENEDSQEQFQVLKQIIDESNDQNLQQGYKSFFENEFFDKVFSTNKDDLSVIDNEKIIGIDLSQLAKEPAFLKMFLSLILSKITERLDGTPTIVYLDRGNAIYELESFSADMGRILKQFVQKNAIAVIGFDKSLELLDNKDFQAHLEYYGSKLFFSDKFADKKFRKALNLSEEELYKIRSYDLSRRVFMLKQKDEVAMLALQLEGLKDELAVLCA